VLQYITKPAPRQFHALEVKSHLQCENQYGHPKNVKVSSNAYSMRRFVETF